MNLFDDPGGSFSVLINHEGQYSLWRSTLDVPVGWQIVHGGDTRQGCLEFIETNWTDLRPLSARRDEAR